MSVSEPHTFDDESFNGEDLVKIIVTVADFINKRLAPDEGENQPTKTQKTKAGISS